MILFNKLGDYLNANGKKYIDMQRDLNLSPSVIAKFQKNRSVTTETINKICEYLCVQPDCIMQWIPDKEYINKEEKKNKIKAEIESLKEELKKYE